MAHLSLVYHSLNPMTPHGYFASCELSCHTSTNTAQIAKKHVCFILHIITYTKFSSLLKTVTWLNISVYQTGIPLGCILCQNDWLSKLKPKCCLRLCFGFNFKTSNIIYLFSIANILRVTLKFTGQKWVMGSKIYEALMQRNTGTTYDVNI